ncbi:hypothetical protein WMF37_30255 [Sorangium sp. So ce291]|uniref:hypothetical protein n=1 Tax=Sorangium sp. So ce291 TaxID=3133294 RepID=UPI003F6037DB
MSRIERDMSRIERDMTALLPRSSSRNWLEPPSSMPVLNPPENLAEQSSASSALGRPVLTYLP